MMQTETRQVSAAPPRAPMSGRPRLFRYTLDDLRRLESPPRAVANMKDDYVLAPLQHPVNDAINMRLLTVKKVPQIGALRGGWTPVRVLFQAKNGLLDTPVPIQSRF